MGEYTLDQLHRMSVANLRKIARELYTGPDKTKINTMRKMELGSLILYEQEKKGDDPGLPLPDPKPDSTPFEDFADFDDIPPDEGDKSTPATPSTPASVSAKHDAIANTLAQLLQGAAVDEELVKRISAETAILHVNELEKKLKKMKKQEIVIVRPGGVYEDVGLQHRDYKKIIDMVNAGLRLALVGPTGSGKTHLVEQVAKGLGLPFHCISVGVQTSMSHLFGFIDAGGTYRPTEFRKAYEHGGLFCLDEFDAGNSNVLVSLNAATSNNIAAFPDKMVRAHENFRIVACGNTYGLGGNITYVGRNQMDEATRKRFAIWEFDYDPKLEAQLTDNTEWVDVVHKTRKAVNDLREKVSVTTRAITDGAKLLELGFKEVEILDMLVYQGVNKDVRDRIEAKRKAA